MYIYSKDVCVTQKGKYTTILETNRILYMDKIKYLDHKQVMKLIINC